MTVNLRSLHGNEEMTFLNLARVDVYSRNLYISIADYLNRLDVLSNSCNFISCFCFIFYIFFICTLLYIGFQITVSEFYSSTMLHTSTFLDDRSRHQTLLYYLSSTYNLGLDAPALHVVDSVSGSHSGNVGYDVLPLLLPDELDAVVTTRSALSQIGLPSA